MEASTFARVELNQTMGHVYKQLYPQNQLIVLFNWICVRINEEEMVETMLFKVSNLMGL